MTSNLQETYVFWDVTIRPCKITPDVSDSTRNLSSVQLQRGHLRKCILKLDDYYKHSISVLTMWQSFLFLVSTCHCTALTLEGSLGGSCTVSHYDKLQLGRGFGVLFAFILFWFLFVVFISAMRHEDQILSNNTSSIPISPEPGYAAAFLFSMD